ncbi:DUF805 domain-containing protein [Palleronia sp. LCG004]|uniref:DUF805 domain-containing protein n=1 Tax=Palleronia sp. LCG004 TaxID=3079304 RepID=UPI002942F634|nr:DUF805 domain-containing protein [Palleronia sp. LCG004]WOI56896.1 DUF805 domain-containing protein [Palleronia sp. LCG004]
MSILSAIRTCLRKYFVFSGRASRSEYWWFAAFVLIGSLVAGFLDGMLFGFQQVEYDPGRMSYESNGPIAAFFSLATFVPLLSAGWRRMHDSGRSGLYLVYPLIVFVGIFVFIGVVAGFEPLLAGQFTNILAGGSFLILGLAFFVFLVSPLLVLWWLTRPSEPSTNRYGPPPYHIDSHPTDPGEIQ